MHSILSQAILLDKELNLGFSNNSMKQRASMNSRYIKKMLLSAQCIHRQASVYISYISMPATLRLAHHNIFKIEIVSNNHSPIIRKE